MPKFCPIMTLIDKLNPDCIEGNCSWWSGRRCAIAALAPKEYPPVPPELLPSPESIDKARKLLEQPPPRDSDQPARSLTMLDQYRKYVKKIGL